MSLISAPTLLTDRLELRAHHPSDLVDCQLIWTTPEVIRYITPQPLNRQEVWTRLLRHLGHWAALGYGYWLVCERQSGRVVGEMGLANFKRDLMQGQPEFSDLPEAGWVLLPEVHGRGYASEGLRAVLAWRDQHLPGRRTFCLIDPANSPSVKLATKFGFQTVREFGEEGARTLLLERG